MPFQITRAYLKRAVPRPHASSPGPALTPSVTLPRLRYRWNEKWLKYDEDCESESCCGWRLAILVSAGVLYIGSIANAMWVVL